MKRFGDIKGFDWDEANRKKCRKHGVSIREIESVFTDRPVLILPDPHADEQRLRAIGKTSSGRYAFVVFTIRRKGGQNFIRPISARYMHSKEVSNYEEEQYHYEGEEEDSDL